MYILVEILYTEFQYISLIKILKYNRNRKTIEKRGKEKNGLFTLDDTIMMIYSRVIMIALTFYTCGRCMHKNIQF